MPVAQRTTSPGTGLRIGSAARRSRRHRATPVFATGPYLEAQPGRAFYPQIEVLFQVFDPAGHYHVPCSA